MNFEQLARRREELVAIRDKAQAEISSMYDEMKSKALEDVIELGLYQARWVHQTGMEYSSSSLPDEFWIDSQDYSSIAVKIRDYLKQKDLRNLELAPGVHLQGSDNIGIRFVRLWGENKTDEIMTPAEFIKHVGLKVSFKNIDEKIAALQKQKKELMG